MERLWAPWRMSYIGKIAGGTGCFLCDIRQSTDDAANLVVVRRVRTFVVLNRFPYNNGHTLICPNEHKGALDQLSSETLCELMRTTSDVMTVLQKEMKPDGFNVGMNFGRVAGAGLPDHLHLHVVPRWSGDTNFMPVLADVKIIPQALEELREKLVTVWKETIHADPSGH
jgi:ATP adenylyltransferase